MDINVNITVKLGGDEEAASDTLGDSVASLENAVFQALKRMERHDERIALLDKYVRKVLKHLGIELMTDGSST